MIAEELKRPLSHLGLAFVLAHPAVTSAILGPRTPDQLSVLLGAADLEIGPDVLDRIDAIVAPGTNLDPNDAS